MMDADKPEYFADYLTRGYEVGDNMRKCIADELRRLDAENAALRDESEGKSKLIKLCLQTADAELIKQKGQINYLVRERNALRAQLAQGGPVDEREAFELNYAKKWQEHSPQAKRHELSFLCSELKEMRCGEKYGDGQDYLNFKWEGWQDRAALKPAVPEGYQLVPIEPTNKELAAGFEAMHRNLHLPTITTVEEIRKAMLAATKDSKSSPTK